MDHLLPLRNSITTDSTDDIQGDVPLISDIFAKPENPGLFLWRIIRFNVFVLHPFEIHAPYPSNRTHLPHSRWQGARQRAQDPYCFLSLSPQTGQTQLSTNFHADSFVSSQGSNSGAQIVETHILAMSSGAVYSGGRVFIKRLRKYVLFLH